MSIALSNLGAVACEEGDLRAARACYREALAIAQALGQHGRHQSLAGRAGGGRGEAGRVGAGGAAGGGGRGAARRDRLRAGARRPRLPRALPGRGARAAGRGGARGGAGRGAGADAGTVSARGRRRTGKTNQPSAGERCAERPSDAHQSPAPWFCSPTRASQRAGKRDRAAGEVPQARSARCTLSCDPFTARSAAPQAPPRCASNARSCPPEPADLDPQRLHLPSSATARRVSTEPDHSLARGAVVE